MIPINPILHLPQIPSHRTAANATGMSKEPNKPSPEQKLRIASALYASARKIKAAALRRKHPDWSETQLLTELNRRFFLLRD